MMFHGTSEEGWKQPSCTFTESVKKYSSTWKSSGDSSFYSRSTSSTWKSSGDSSSYSSSKTSYDNYFCSEVTINGINFKTERTFKDGVETVNVYVNKKLGNTMFLINLIL